MEQQEKRETGQVDDGELKEVIKDFLAMGHVDNIVAMFRHEERYYQWIGEILADERFQVRLGVAVLFEELQKYEPDKLELALPTLENLLQTALPLYRGEALSLLGIVGGEKARGIVARFRKDSNPQVREMAELVLAEL